MGCRNKCSSSYFFTLTNEAGKNTKERCTVVKGAYMKVNVMSIACGGEIGAEVHEKEDQLITVVCGTATVKYGSNKCVADCVRKLNAGESVFIPAGTWHNVCNSSNGLLKLISSYGYASNVCAQSTEVSGCGCAQSTSVAGAQNAGCGCSQAVGTVQGTVFNASDYNWNTTQTQERGCGCHLNSGC